MSVTVRFQNKERLAKKFKQLAPQAARALAIVNQQLAQDMVATAQGYVPVAPVDGGTLRNSIRAEPAGTETGAWRVLAGGPATTKAARSGQGAYDYALGVEFGTSDTPTQPFFFPSYRLVKRRHKGRATRAVNQANKKVARW